MNRQAEAPRDALRKYGQHQTSCRKVSVVNLHIDQWPADRDCTCGLDAALSALPAEQEVLRHDQGRAIKITGIEDAHGFEQDAAGGSLPDNGRRQLESSIEGSCLASLPAAPVDLPALRGLVELRDEYRKWQATWKRRGDEEAPIGNTEERTREDAYRCIADQLDALIRRAEG